MSITIQKISQDIILLAKVVNIFFTIKESIVKDGMTQTDEEKINSFMKI